MTAYHIGIDLHRMKAQACVRDAQGEIHEEKGFRLDEAPDRNRFLDWLEGFAPSCHVAVEALGCNRWFVKACRDRGLPILVADASQLHLKRAGKKTDKRDAREIARRLYLGDLHRHARTYFATEAEYRRRKLLRTKHALTSYRTSQIARIRGFLNAEAIRPPAGTLYTQTSLRWLRGLDLGDEIINAAFQALVEVLEATHRQLAKLEARIERVARGDETCAWMMEHIPQVGAQTALTLVSELGAVDRFENPRAVAAYVGLVPRVTASADRSHHGRLTKRGNRELRYIVGQWAVRLAAKVSQVKTWAEAMMKRVHKNKVRMALARRLVVGIWAMLARGEVFSMERCLSRQA